MQQLQFTMGISPWFISVVTDGAIRVLSDTLGQPSSIVTVDGLTVEATIPYSDPSHHLDHTITFGTKQVTGALVSIASGVRSNVPTDIVDSVAMAILRDEPDCIGDASLKLIGEIAVFGSVIV